MWSLIMKSLLIALLVSISVASFASTQLKPLPMAGPNCHVVNAALSNDGGISYKQIAKNILKSASVPDAVHFKGKDLIYYVNGDFDKHSIYVAELHNGGKSPIPLGPIRLDGKIIKDAVDPDLIVTPDGKLRLFYYVGMFTVPVRDPKPNKIYSAISSDGINFEIEGVMAALDGPTDPTVTKIPNGNYLLAVPQGEKQKITIYESPTGYNFKKLTTIKGGIPELSVGLDGRPQILYQEREIVLKTSSDGGKSWKTIRNDIVSGAPVGISSPSVVITSKKERIMYYFWAEKGCSTPPTAYLENKGALAGMGPNNSAMGEPPLGHGVTPKGKKKN